jgi:hypothetical protein
MMARLLWGRLVEFFPGDPLYVVILSITIVGDADFHIFLQGTTLFLPLLSLSSPILIWSSNLAWGLPDYYVKRFFFFYLVNQLLSKLVPVCSYFSLITSIWSRCLIAQKLQAKRRRIVGMHPIYNTIPGPYERKLLSIFHITGLPYNYMCRHAFFIPFLQ